MRAGAELHDIGKAAIPDAILAKPGPLDEGEWAFMRRHTLIGERIVASAPALATWPARALLSRALGRHRLPRRAGRRRDPARRPDHRRVRRVRRDVADRPYSKGLGFERALDELEHCAGSQFDPQVVAAFVEVSRGRAASPLDELPKNFFFLKKTRAQSRQRRR